MITTSQVQREIDRLERDRESLVKRIATCPEHIWRQVGPDRCFMGPVAEARPGAKYNPAAHGNIMRTVACRCGAERRENINGCHIEVSGVHAPTDEIDDRLRAARSDLDRQRELDIVERSAWRHDGPHWTLAVPDALPVRVAIVPYRDSPYVVVRLDGIEATYSLNQLEDAGRASHLDDAQRTAWALIARRAYEAVQAVRS